MPLMEADGDMDGDGDMPLIDGDADGDGDEPGICMSIGEPPMPMLW